MVPRWKKLAYSLGSVIVGTVAFATLLCISSGSSAGVGGTLVIFGAAITGWIVSIPLILRINNVSGWRFWLYLGIGTSPGPILVFVLVLVPFIQRAIRIYHAQNTAVAFVTFIGLGLVAIPFFVGTLTYLLWLRQAQRNLLKRMNLIAVNR